MSREISLYRKEQKIRVSTNSASTASELRALLVNYAFLIHYIFVEPLSGNLNL